MIFYHNLTKQRVNISDIESLALNSEPSDVIMCTRSGDALLFPLEGAYLEALDDERQRLIELEAKEDDYHQTD